MSNGAPSSFGLSGGSCKDSGKDFNKYMSSYGEMGSGEGIIARDETPGLVDTFYSLVTDIYEWGWGQSFHFAPRLAGQDDHTSEVAHECHLAACLQVQPGQKVLDAGCGVGGPMRRIAARTGAHVTGVTINQYQVDRATKHNRDLGLEKLTNVVQGNFLELDQKFAEGTFDAAYAIEATCHAPDLSEVYGQIYKVLKPGGRFVTYEWVATDLWDKGNPVHVKIMDEINKGNGLPDMRTRKEAEAAAEKAGFKIVSSIDLATVATPPNTPWTARLSMNRFQHFVNAAIVTSLDAIGLLPAGVKDAHDMLVNVAHWLVEGGKTGVFTPMQLMVLEKPAN